MRRSIATVSAVLLGLALTQGTAHAVPSKTDPGPSAAQLATLALGGSVAPKAAAGAKPAGANPFLALVPDATKVDYAGWAKYLKTQASARAAARLKTLAALKSPALKVAAAAPIAIDEDEPDGTSGSNDSPATAQEINDFGTAAKKAPKIRILGSLDNETIAVSSIAPSTEDDGDINKAASTGINTARDGATTTGTIGDGPYGSAGTGTNDYDFYSLTVSAGQVITVTTATPTGLLDTVVVLYDATGNEVAFNDDFSGLDSQLQYRSPAAGTFYAAVAGYRGVPVDPFDSSQGTGDGSEGPYTVTIKAGAVDADYYGVKLRPGDVVGASVSGSATVLNIFDTAGRLVHGSEQDATFIYPMESPLPGGGNAANDYVATKAGWYYVGVETGSGPYQITFEGYRPVLQGAKPTQTLFLDFDGGRFNTGGVFGGTGNVDLSPFSAFIAKWGLTNADKNRLITAIVAGVTENLKQDMIASGLNAKFKLKVLNSRDNPDPWGQANVSRIVVGGTIAESGINTIGIAQSIDPGNFATEETAYVLLDVLSDPSGAASLNTYITPASDKVAFVGHALSNVISHEGGHFFGNFHTDNQDAQVNLMDAGGTGFANLFGVGPDGVGGTADDPDVDFGEDQFLPAEGFTGIEDTLGRVAFGLTS